MDLHLSNTYCYLVSETIMKLFFLFKNFNVELFAKKLAFCLMACHFQKKYIDLWECGCNTPMNKLKFK